MSKAKIICVATGIFPPDTGGPAKFAETFLAWCQQNDHRVEAVSLTDTATKDISFENMKTAIIIGSAMASFCVEKFGTTRMREITKEDINARIRQFVDLVNFDINII